jgi:hypothetical protein
VDRKLGFALIDGKVFDMGFQYAVNTPEKGCAGDRSQREVADEEEPSHERCTSALVPKNNGQRCRG